jgi:hypothetical protein
MALEFTKDGKISLNNRLAIPENGEFIKDVKRWDFIKRCVHSSMKWEITIDFIDETFSAIKDPITGFTYSSPCDQFEKFLNQQRHIKFIKKDFSYLIFHYL